MNIENNYGLNMFPDHVRVFKDLDYFVLVFQIFYLIDIFNNDLMIHENKAPWPNFTILTTTDNKHTWWGGGHWVVVGCSMVRWWGIGWWCGVAWWGVA